MLEMTIAVINYKGMCNWIMLEQPDIESDKYKC